VAVTVTVSLVVLSFSLVVTERRVVVGGCSVTVLVRGFLVVADTIVVVTVTRTRRGLVLTETTVVRLGDTNTEVTTT
jgi:hypothetical protein